MEAIVDLVIHVGFRKTATSWLQNILFPRLDINYIGKTESDYPNWLIEWHYADDFYFEQRVRSIQEHLASRLIEKKCNLLSSEAFTNTAVIYSQAQRIRAIWPKARILVTLRDPVAMVWSHYRGDIKEGTCFDEVEHRLDWKRTPYVMDKRRAIYLPDFFFDESICLYKDLFGPENVCVLKYEDMRSNRSIYFVRLFEFLGIAPNIPLVDLLAEKVNESPKAVASLERLKQENFNRFLLNHFQNLPIRRAVYPEKSESKPGRTGIDGKLRKRLQDYFKGKTHGYY